MKKLLLALAIFCFVTSVQQLSAQIQLQYQSGFAVGDAEDLAYIPHTDQIAVISSDAGGPGIVGVRLYSVAGVQESTIVFDPTGLAVDEFFLDKGVATLPNGNLIVVSNLAIIYEIDMSTGQIVPNTAGGFGGFDVFVLGPDVTPNGLLYEDLTNQLWVASENGDLLARLDEFGQPVFGPVSAFPSPASSGDAEGIGFSPGCQTLLVADDTNDVLVEITSDGQFIQTIDLASLTGGSGFLLDPEGVATDHANGRVFISNDDGNGPNIMVFSATTNYQDIIPAISLFRGMQVAGTEADGQASDNSYMRFNPGFTINDTEAPVWLIFNGNVPASTGCLVGRLEGNAGTPGLSSTIESWNWSTSSYDVVSVDPTSFNADAVVAVEFSSVNDYVQPGSNSVRVRIGWRQTGFTINFPWEVRLDAFNWQVAN